MTDVTDVTDLAEEPPDAEADAVVDPPEAATTGADAADAPPPRVVRWLFTPVPLGRIAMFRTVIYLFVLYDVTQRSSLAHDRGALSTALYRPLWIARTLHPLVPGPTHTALDICYWGLIIGCLVGATTYLPRLAGTVVFLCYFEWMLVAMSYGKVDHDRFGLLLALALLPTIGRARPGDRTPSEHAGWCLRIVQLGVIATYFLAAWAKFRFGGVGWAWSGTLAWAIQRRGTSDSLWLLDHPLVLRLIQFFTIAFEGLSPVILFLKERWQWCAVAGLYFFHYTTALALTITFAPHLAAMTSFLPLEVLWPPLALALWRERKARKQGPEAGPEHEAPVAVEA